MPFFNLQGESQLGSESMLRGSPTGPVSGSFRNSGTCSRDLRLIAWIYVQRCDSPPPMSWFFFVNSVSFPEARLFLKESGTRSHECSGFWSQRLKRSKSIRILWVSKGEAAPRPRNGTLGEPASAACRKRGLFCANASLLV